MWSGRRCVVVVIVSMVVASGCSRDRDTPASTSDPKSHTVGSVTETFVNTTQPLAGDAATSDRSLVTTIFYPARGTVGPDPVADAPADRSDGPYPLVVFAHGLGGSPAAYQGLLAEWAAAGYVVAAPAFPKTNIARRVGSIPVTSRTSPQM